MVHNVSHTSNNANNLSRGELLNWINKLLVCDYKKIEHLCTGAAYCQLFDILFPGVINLKRIKFMTNIDHEFRDNFKILQVAFDKLRVTKQIPVTSLTKCRFQDNLEFVQWFKKFFDANKKEVIDYDAPASRFGIPLGYGPAVSKRKGKAAMGNSIYSVKGKNAAMLPLQKKAGTSLSLNNNVKEPPTLTLEKKPDTGIELTPAAKTNQGNTDGNYLSLWNSLQVISNTAGKALQQKSAAKAKHNDNDDDNSYDGNDYSDNDSDDDSNNDNVVDSDDDSDNFDDASDDDIDNNVRKKPDKAIKRTIQKKKPVKAVERKTAVKSKRNVGDDNVSLDFRMKKLVKVMQPKKPRNIIDNLSDDDVSQSCSPKKKSIKIIDWKIVGKATQEDRHDVSQLTSSKRNPVKALKRKSAVKIIENDSDEESPLSFPIKKSVKTTERKITSQVTSKKKLVWAINRQSTAKTIEEDSYKVSPLLSSMKKPVMTIERKITSEVTSSKNKPISATERRNAAKTIEEDSNEVSLLPSLMKKLVKTIERKITSEVTSSKKKPVWATERQNAAKKIEEDSYKVSPLPSPMKKPVKAIERDITSQVTSSNKKRVLATNRQSTAKTIKKASDEISPSSSLKKRTVKTNERKIARKVKQEDSYYEILQPTSLKKKPVKAIARKIGTKTKQEVSDDEVSLSSSLKKNSGKGNVQFSGMPRRTIQKSNTMAELRRKPAQMYEDDESQTFAEITSTSCSDVQSGHGRSEIPISVSRLRRHLTQVSMKKDTTNNKCSTTPHKTGARYRKMRSSSSSMQVVTSKIHNQKYVLLADTKKQRSQGGDINKGQTDGTPVVMLTKDVLMELLSEVKAGRQNRTASEAPIQPEIPQKTTFFEGFEPTKILKLTQKLPGALLGKQDDAMKSSTKDDAPESETMQYAVKEKHLTTNLPSIKMIEVTKIIKPSAHSVTNEISFNLESWVTYQIKNVVQAAGNEKTSSFNKNSILTDKSQQTSVLRVPKFTCNRFEPQANSTRCDGSASTSIDVSSNLENVNGTESPESCKLSARMPGNLLKPPQDRYRDQLNTDNTVDFPCNQTLRVSRLSKDIKNINLNAPWKPSNQATDNLSLDVDSITEAIEQLHLNAEVALPVTVDHHAESNVGMQNVTIDGEMVPPINLNFSPVDSFVSDSEDYISGRTYHVNNESHDEVYEEENVPPIDLQYLPAASDDPYSMHNYDIDKELPPLPDSDSRLCSEWNDKDKSAFYKIDESGQRSEVSSTEEYTSINKTGALKISSSKKKNPLTNTVILPCSATTCSKLTKEDLELPINVRLYLNKKFFDYESSELDDQAHCNLTVTHRCDSSDFTDCPTKPLNDSLIPLPTLVGGDEMHHMYLHERISVMSQEQYPSRLQLEELRSDMSRNLIEEFGVGTSRAHDNLTDSLPSSEDDEKACAASRQIGTNICEDLVRRQELLARRAELTEQLIDLQVASNAMTSELYYLYKKIIRIKRLCDKPISQDMPTKTELLNMLLAQEENVWVDFD